MAVIRCGRDCRVDCNLIAAVLTFTIALAATILISVNAAYFPSKSDYDKQASLCAQSSSNNVNNCLYSWCTSQSAGFSCQASDRLNEYGYDPEYNRKHLSATLHDKGSVGRGFAALGLLVACGVVQLLTHCANCIEPSGAVASAKGPGRAGLLLAMCFWAIWLAAFLLVGVTSIISTHAWALYNLSRASVIASAVFCGLAAVSFAIYDCGTRTRKRSYDPDPETAHERLRPLQKQPSLESPLPKLDPPVLPPMQPPQNKPTESARRTSNGSSQGSTNQNFQSRPESTAASQPSESPKSWDQEFLTAHQQAQAPNPPQHPFPQFVVNISPQMIMNAPQPPPSEPPKPVPREGTAKVPGKGPTVLGEAADAVRASVSEDSSGQFFSGEVSTQQLSTARPPPPPPYSFGSSGSSSGGYPSTSSEGQARTSGFRPSTVTQYTIEELQRATNGFAEERKLGSGGFGSVYKGMLPDGSIIAVKRLHAGVGPSQSSQGLREFQAEVEIISRVHHRNLVKLVGYCSDEIEQLLVYEYMPKGSLDSHLYSLTKPPLTWEQRQKIAIGAARGLQYLHDGCEPRVVHRDLKAANILLDSNFNAQVADFGLARFLGDEFTHATTRVMGTFGYLAPEYALSGRLTEKADVWSFGVLLLSLVTGKKPIFAPEEGEPLTSLVEWAWQMQQDSAVSPPQLADPRLEGSFAPPELHRMWTAGISCVHHLANKRPTMEQVVRLLTSEDPLPDVISNSGSRTSSGMPTLVENEVEVASATLGESTQVAKPEEASQVAKLGEESQGIEEVPEESEEKHQDDEVRETEAHHGAVASWEDEGGGGYPKASLEESLPSTPQEVTSSSGGGPDVVKYVYSSGEYGPGDVTSGRFVNSSGSSWSFGQQWAPEQIGQTVLLPERFTEGR